jgi:hypothetical protein
MPDHTTILEPGCYLDGSRGHYITRDTERKHMHAIDVIAYTYNADTYCPHCVAVAFERTEGPSLFDGAEAILDARATEAGIDRYAEETFDSGDFPKVVFASMVEGDENCGSCHSRLV